MPEDGTAWRRSLAALDAEARLRHAGTGFAALTVGDRIRLLRVLGHRAGLPAGRSRPWHGLPLAHVWELWLRHACGAYYSHPAAWDETGFGGPAYPRGYVRLGRGVREVWEDPHPAPAPHADDPRRPPTRTRPPPANTGPPARNPAPPPAPGAPPDRPRAPPRPSPPTAARCGGPPPRPCTRRCARRAPYAPATPPPGCPQRTNCCPGCAGSPTPTRSTWSSSAAAPAARCSPSGSPGPAGGWCAWRPARSGTRAATGSATRRAPAGCTGTSPG
ncbi:gluconate 2-dehydrogenase subunit 3 family protein [Streptomyces sp. SBR177]